MPTESISSQNRPHRCLPLAALCAIMLTQCAAPISVHHEQPARPPTVAAEGLAKQAPELIERLHTAYLQLVSGDDSAIPDYNYLLGRLIEELEPGGVDPWSQPIDIGGYRLRGKPAPGSRPSENQLFVADTLEFRGKFAGHRARVPGIGAPVVEVTTFDGIGREEIRTNLPVRNLTAMMRFNGTSAELELLDPYQTEQVNLAGRRLPLADDPGAAVMLGLSKARVDKLGLARLLRPSRYNDTAHLNFVQPYDPNRIPVLMVHGLQDTPATWAPAYFRLIDDPVIREKYQFWVFSYPSGYPYPYSASLLRRELDNVRRQFPDHKDIVIVGHSMGSLITRLMVTDVGDKLWLEVFDKTPAETPLAGLSREILEDSIVFNHRPEIDRVIFISAPHRGSVLASNWIGAIGTRLVRLPSFMADTRNAVISVATVDASAVILQRTPNSIDTLSPNNRFVQEINKIPIHPGIPYHSIIGDRGKGDTPDSSDGVVAYWSSHLGGAVSEKIVPSHHSANQHPEGIEEIRRILLLHIGK